MQYKYGNVKHKQANTLSHTHIHHTATHAHTNSVYIRNHVKQRNEY